MGNKGATTTSSGKGLKTQQPLPRNIASLYGPKPTASENNLSDQSGFSSVSSVSTSVLGNKLDDDGDKDKIQLRLSRVHRCRRSDGFQNHESEESLASAIRNVTKFIDTFSSVNVGTCLLESSNLSAFLHENTLELSKKQSLIEELLQDQAQENKTKQTNPEEKHLEASDKGASKCDANSRKQEDNDQEIDNQNQPKMTKEDQADKLSDQDPTDVSTRPTACFRNPEHMSFSPFAKSQNTRETFGGAGGILVPALEDKASLEKDDDEDDEDDFVPCRQTANFGNLERSNQRKQQEQLKALERLNKPLNEREIKEDENEEDEGREDSNADYLRDIDAADNYNNQNDQYYNNNNNYEEDDDEEEEYSEPIYLKIDLSAQTKKKRDIATGGIKDINQHGLQNQNNSQRVFDETIERSLQEDENLLDETEDKEQQEFQLHESEIQQQQAQQGQGRQQTQLQQEPQQKIEQSKLKKSVVDQTKLQDQKEKTSTIPKIDKGDICKSPKNSKSPTGAIRRKEQDQNEEVQVKQVFLQNTTKGIKRSVTPNIKSSSNTNSTIHINSKSKSPFRSDISRDHEDIKKDQVKEKKVIMKSNSFSIIKTIKTKPNELEKKENKKDVVNTYSNSQKDKNALNKMNLGENQNPIKQCNLQEGQVDDKKPSFRETVDALDDQMDELLNQIYGDLSNVKAKIQKDKKLSPSPSKNVLETGKPANL